MIFQEPYTQQRSALSGWSRPRIDRSAPYEEVYGGVWLKERKVLANYANEVFLGDYLQEIYVLKIRGFNVARNASLITSKFFNEIIKLYLFFFSYR